MHHFFVGNPEYKNNLKLEKPSEFFEEIKKNKTLNTNNSTEFKNNENWNTGSNMKKTFKEDPQQENYEKQNFENHWHKISDSILKESKKSTNPSIHSINRRFFNNNH